MHSQKITKLTVQVRHIPITVALHVEGRGWTYDANDWFYMALRPNYALFRPVGEFCLHFHDGDEYAWNGVRLFQNSYSNNAPCRVSAAPFVVPV